MRRLLLFLVGLLLCSTEIHAFAILGQTEYRWRNNDGDEVTATYIGSPNTPTTIGPNGVIRLRLELANSGASAATINQKLEYSSNGGASWILMNNNALTDTFLYLPSTFVTDGTPTTNQSSASTAGTFVPGKIITTPGATAAQSLAASSKTEYEWVIGPNPALPPIPTVTYLFRESGLTTLPTTYPALTYLSSATGCFGSGNLTTSNISTNGADLGWTEFGTASQWQIEYGPGTSFALGTGTRSAVSSNPYTLSGLTQGGGGAQYSFFVRSICGPNDTSVWSQRKSFTLIASCDTPTAPTASNITTNSADLGWVENGSATQWQIEYGVGSSFTLGTGTRSVTTTNPHSLIGLAPSTSYTYFVRSICGPNDTSVWSPRSPVFATLAACDTPTAPTASNITSNSADLAWVENGTASQWQIEYGVGNTFTLGTGTRFATSTNPHSLAGLTPSTIYTYFVRSICGPGDTSVWSVRSPIIATIATCDTPTALAVSNLTTGTADMTWTENGSATMWQISYVQGSTAAAATGTKTIVTSNPYSFSGSNLFTQGVQYSAFVRSICGAGDTSAWSNRVLFGIPPVNDDCSNAIDIVNNLPVAGDNSVAAADPLPATPTCGSTTTTTGTANGMWYKVTPTAGGSLTVQTCGMATWDTYIRVYDGACGAFTNCMGFSDDDCSSQSTVTFTAVANTTYYILVGRYSTASGLGAFSVQVTGSAPLAVKLSNIAATNTGASNRIEWSTASEESSDKFELQRSIDGKHFATIYKQDANGAASRYTYTDNNAVKGMNYYRLRMTAANGNATYSETVSAFVKSNGFEVEAFPNPVSHELTVKVSGVQGADATVQVTDVTGKVIKTVKMHASLEYIDMSGLANGIYLIKYSDASHTQTIKVNKQ